MKDTKICKRCEGEFPITSFHKAPLSPDGRVPKCKDCTKLYKVELRIRKNGYELDSLEHDMFMYFSKMGVYLNGEQVEDVVYELTTNKDNYLGTLDKMQEKYGAKAENYEDSLLEELRSDRIAVQSLYISRGAGRYSKRRVNQMDLEGNHIKTFESIADAAMEVSGSLGSSGAISGCANGLCYQAYGFIFEYNDEYYER